MEKEEIEKLLQDVAKKNGEAISEATKQAVSEAAKGLVTVEQLNKTLEEAGLKKDAIKSLTEAIEKQGLEITKLIGGKGKQEEKTIEQAVAEKGEAIKALAGKTSKDSNGNVRFTVNKTMVQRSGVSSNTMGVRLPGVGQIAHRAAVMRSIFPSVRLSDADYRDSNGVIYYLDQNAITRNAAAVAELAGTTVGSGNKPESAISWIERTLKLETIADTIPVTKQAYRNLGFVAGELDQLLRVNLELAVDAELYSGDGSTPNLSGVYTTAGAVALDSTLPGYGVINDANVYDLIAAVRTLIMTGGTAGTGKQSKYAPNFVIMNPVDILKYKLAKATDGHYLLPPFISADGMRIDNVMVIESSQVTANTLVMGDSNYGRIYEGEDVTIEMGWVNDQFVKNQWTIRAEQVIALLIRNVDADGFKKVTDIGAAVAALETP